MKCDFKGKGFCESSPKKKCWDQGGDCEKVRSCKDKAFCGYKLGRGECLNCAHDKFMKKWELYCRTDDITHIL